MKTEKKLYTQKVKTFKKLCDLIWEGKELTYYSGVGVVNMMDNKKFLDALDLINENNYLKDIDEKQFTRNNKLLDRMTVAQIEKEIAKHERVVKIYRDMPNETRKALAIGTMINHYEKCINKYEMKLLAKKDIVYIEAITRLKNDIEKLYDKLVA